MGIHLFFFCTIHVATCLLPKNAYRVDDCPEANNIAQWINASNRLNCSEYRENYKNIKGVMLYHCLPSIFLNETIEFCGPIAAIQKGQCPIYNYEFGATTATGRSCTNFTEGCPQPRHSPYHSSSFYKYKACLDIKKDFQCFSAEPTCPQRGDKRYQTTSLSTEEDRKGYQTTSLSTEEDRKGYQTTSLSTEEDRKGYQTTSLSTEEDRKGFIIIALGCILACLIAIIIGLLIRNHRKKKKATEEMESFLPGKTGHKCLSSNVNERKIPGPEDLEDRPPEDSGIQTHLRGDSQQPNENDRPISEDSGIAEQDDDDVGKQRKLFENMHKTAPYVSFNLFCVKLKTAMTPKVFETIKDLLKGGEENDTYEVAELKNTKQLLDYLNDKYLLFNNVVFLQGLFLAANAPELNEICLEYAKKEEEEMHFFEEKILENNHTKIQYYINVRNVSSYRKSELEKLRKSLKTMLSANYDDVIVCGVKEGCVVVTFMIRNCLIPRLTALYESEEKIFFQKMSNLKVFKIIMPKDVVHITDQLKTGKKADLTELKPYDARLMMTVNKEPVSLVLEGFDVGRGNAWHDGKRGFTQEQGIVTLDVTVWHVMENGPDKIPEASYGQFHSGDTYVVKWQYKITTEDESLNGTQYRRSLNTCSSERCAYFFWQGNNSTINKKGDSALLTIKMDKERGPQVRVAEGKEMPCFLNLFKGRMISHRGKRESMSTYNQRAWRCYCVRGDHENEICLIEISMGADRLRSRASIILLNVKSGQLFVWHGCKAPPHCKELAVEAAKKLKEKCPLEVGVNKGVDILITQMEEGAEKTEFWSALGVKANTRFLYSSYLTDPIPYDYTLRMFYMSSASGIFKVDEKLNPSRSLELITPFPFLQRDLYNASQPSLFLLDDDNTVYLWHGWWPEAEADVKNIQTGSAKALFNVNRKCAIETALNYCKEKNSENPPEAVAVYAGLEPMVFTNLFPYWDVEETVRSLNLRDGKHEGEMTPLKDILGKMTKSRYTYKELRKETLPEGVDAKRRESYLEDDEFEKIMNISREEFDKLPQWRKDDLKKKAELF